MLGPATSFETSELGREALAQAKELFAQCDQEGKGFIIKRDMHRLSSQLPNFSPDQLEEVFDSLDNDHNGYLSPEEFVRGFGEFLGLKGPDDDSDLDNDEHYDAGHKRGVLDHDEQGDDERQFQQFVESLGADVFKDQATLRAVWSRMKRRGDHETMDNFVDFISSVAKEMRSNQEETTTLEQALRNRSQTHDHNVRRLYDDMEAQIREEKERAAAEERTKSEQLRRMMESELKSKDDQMHDMQTHYAMLEERLRSMGDEHAATQFENEQMHQERQAFEQLRDEMDKEMASMRSAYEAQRAMLDELKDQQKREKRERAQAALKITEGIASEREDLVQELEALKAMNKKLQDERDELALQASQGRKRSSMYNLMEELTIQSAQKSTADDINQSASGFANPTAIDESDIESISRVESEEEYVPGPKNLRSIAHVHPIQNSLADELHGEATNRKMTPQRAPTIEEEYEERAPDRIFKVVFVGDSGVGKTCVLQRFCHNQFKQTFSATIGVDFTVKSLRVADRLVALQLWDTAGQERFRSITKQYFRKADGVVIMYDVTSEQSFLNVRNWLNSVKDGVEEHCVLCLVANKIDLCETEDDRAVLYKDGNRLADDNDCLYFETSARSGVGVVECMKELAMRLQQKEDQAVQDALKLEDNITVVKRKRCCKT